MKKKYIVSASLLTLLGLGVITSQEVYGAEVVSATTKEATTESKTEDNIVSNANITLDQIKEFSKFIDDYASDEDLKDPLNIGTVLMKNTYFKHLVKKDVKPEGTVGTNLGLTLPNPNTFGADELGQWLFNLELNNYNIYDLKFSRSSNNYNLNLRYSGNVTDSSAFSIKALDGKLDTPKIGNIIPGDSENELALDFSEIVENSEGKQLKETYQLYFHNFPLIKFSVDINENEMREQTIQENEIKHINDTLYAIYMTSDFKADHTYKAGDTIELHYWLQVDDDEPEQIKTTKVTFTKSQSNQPEKPGDNESEKPQPKDSVIVYRLYNPNNGDHLFTQSDKEYKELEAVGWEGEGVAWFTPKKTNIPVYRLYNPNTGEHFYTDSEKEYNKVGKAGWDQEGIAFYSLKMTDEDSQAIYRTFNPNTDGPGSHMFTVSAKEYNQMVRAGWRGERIAFYGVE